jgi:hypothetical protein
MRCSGGGFLLSSNSTSNSWLTCLASALDRDVNLVVHAVRRTIKPKTNQGKTLN